jgi:fatty acid desaturase
MMYVAYTLARSFYPLLAAAVIWGTLLWSPFVTALLAPLLVHLATNAEEIGPLERVCRRLRSEGEKPRKALRFLTNAGDLQQLIFLLIVYANYASAFYIYLNRLPAGWLPRLCFLFGAGTMLGWNAGINLGVVYHNQLHRGAFRNKALNRWMGRLWTIPSGWPSYFWQYKHAIIHHKHVGEACDWVQPHRQPNGHYESIRRYVFCHWPWRYGRCLWREFATGPKRVRRAAIGELLLFLPFWIAPFLIDPLLGAGLWIFPHWFGSAFILGTGMYTQHAGGTTEMKYSGSTTFLSEFFNLTMFNVGYHTEHHANPSAHWSELPALHARLKPELIEGGAHIVPYGSYHASAILSSRLKKSTALARFRQQHPDYVPGAAHV